MPDAIELGGTRAEVAYLRTTKAIRDRSRKLAERAIVGGSDTFAVDLGAMAKVADEVAALTKERYPSLDVPIHGRLRHFDAGGRARCSELEARIASLDPVERARIKIDLIVPSVLLDAGAGPDWAFDEDGVKIGRSEGLAVASYHLFVSGKLSSDGKSLRCDAEGLSRITAAELGAAFQVSDDNPIVGLEGRAHLLRALGEAIAERTDVFGSPLETERAAGAKHARPGHLVDALLAQAKGKAITDETVLALLLDGLSTIWPGRVSVAGQNLGDVWPHPALGTGVESLVPFHKLSQWLTYSLLEPAIEAGVQLSPERRLTGLPEYRNGGLLVDHGVLSLRNPADLGKKHAPGSPLVVEWRALTVHLLDALAPMIRERLGAKGEGLPLASLLEGGTWAAGRKIANELRQGRPPLDIDSDGTVF
jgi:hypothetical protein